MNIETTDHYYTRNILIQIGILSLAGIGVVVWQRDILTEIYFHNQLGQVGLVINGGIVLLFLTGLVRLVSLFFFYNREEQMLNLFILNVRQKLEHSQGVYAQSLIAQRYRTLADLHGRHSHINHNALAATLLAGESSRLGFPRFVHNVLILTGVFGTIVSLSIALLGASDMISSIEPGAFQEHGGGLAAVIHGMSTALSTTMTAIIAYLFFGYFYLRLHDIQTYLISRIEDLTTTVLLPRFQVTHSDSAVAQFSEMIRAAAHLIDKLDASQRHYQKAAERLADVLDRQQAETRQTNEALEDVIRLLQEGFRLTETTR